jgi:hypothetical protein
MPLDLVASDTSIETALELVKLFECIGMEAATSAADFRSKPSAWMSPAPAAAFRRERLRLRTVWAWLRVLFRPAASVVVHDHIGLR